MYAPLTVANTLIQISRPRDPLWLNKATFLVHGWSLAFDRSLVAELPKVWRYGPIYESLYDALRSHKMRELSAPQPLPGSTSTPTIPESDAFAVALIREVLDKHGHLTSTQMSSLCHAEGGPWHAEAKEHCFRMPTGHTIPEWRIQAHYKRLLVDFQKQQRLAA